MMAARQGYYQGGSNLTTRPGGPEIAPDNTPANIVSVDEGIIPKFERIADLRDWLISYFSGREPIIVNSTGAEVIFTVRGVKGSVKLARVKKDAHRKTYGGLDRLIQEAVYAGFDEKDSRHLNVIGQDVYYSAMEIGGVLYGVRLRLDVPLQGNRLNYKDHKVTEIDIAPIRNTTVPQSGQSTELGAISNVSLEILKDNVKPSRIEDGTLRQSPRGFINIDGNKVDIGFLKDANLSTFLHETGHFFQVESSSPFLYQKMNYIHLFPSAFIFRHCSSDMYISVKQKSFRGGTPLYRL